MADPRRLSILLVRPENVPPDLLRQLAADALVDLSIDAVGSISDAVAKAAATAPDAVVISGSAVPAEVARFPAGLPVFVVADVTVPEENGLILGGAAGVFPESRLARLPTALVRESSRAVEHASLLQAEADRTRLLAQLVHAQKMEAIGTLAGGLAHDLNNVLMGILGNAEMAAEDIGIGHPAQSNLADVIRAANRAREVVQRVLTFSRKREPARRSDQLPQVVDDAVVLLRATLPATIELLVRHEPGPPPVSIDANQINQVITNLATNARDAIGSRPGTITISSSVIDVDRTLARTHVNLAVRRYVRLSVTDDGPGIPPNLLPRVFEPFFTTKAPGAGTGLGLAVAHGIIEEHEGAITVESTMGHGTTVHIYLPAIEPARTGDDPGAAAPRGAGEAVLLVDDEAMVVRIGARMLERLGYRVTAADSATAALEIFAAEPARFQVVISDLTMPGHTGLDLARRFRTLNPQIKFILTTGHLGAEQQALPDTDALLTKPFAAARLAQVLDAVLHRHESVTP